MLKFNKEKILNIKHKNNAPLLPSNSKGETIQLNRSILSEKIRIKKLQDINGMQITYDVIKKKN